MASKIEENYDDIVDFLAEIERKECDCDAEYDAEGKLHGIECIACKASDILDKILPEE